jgi:hypothetical protein
MAWYGWNRGRDSCRNGRSPLHAGDLTQEQLKETPDGRQVGVGVIVGHDRNSRHGNGLDGDSRDGNGLGGSRGLSCSDHHDRLDLVGCRHRLVLRWKGDRHGKKGKRSRYGKGNDNWLLLEKSHKLSPGCRRETHWHGGRNWNTMHRRKWWLGKYRIVRGKGGNEVLTGLVHDALLG